MKKIIINGNNKLSGKVKIGGAKNSVVALLPAAILSSGKVEISNVPNISDKDALFDILTHLKAEIEYDGDTLKVDCKNSKNIPVPYELAKRLRASYYLMGVLLAKYKHAEVYFPGGCKIGERPIDLHLKGFEALGATVTNEEDKYIIKAEKLVGCPINLDFASVGATINIMFAATMAEGITTITNAAKEPEIMNIADFLISMGAKVEGAGTSTIKVAGVKQLNDGKISVMPDRIEAGTYVIIGALIGDSLEIDGIVEDHLSSLLNKLTEMNIKYELNNQILKISKPNLPVKSINIKSLVYPGFPTDLGQPMQVLLSKATGTSIFEETIYDNRMGHVKYLRKMGALMEDSNSILTINGPTNYKGAKITAVDLRGGAALVLAGLIADGITVISDADHILRGYENIINKLTDIGAKISIEEI